MKIFLLCLNLLFAVVGLVQGYTNHNVIYNFRKGDEFFIEDIRIENVCYTNYQCHQVKALYLIDKNGYRMKFLITEVSTAHPTPTGPPTQPQTGVGYGSLPVDMSLNLSTLKGLAQG